MANRPGNDDRTMPPGGQSNPDNSRQGAGTANGSNANGQARTRSNRGFASMDREKQKEIASKGGRAAHAKGTAHEFDSGEAREAGRKGGVAVSRNREHMAAIGRRGGEARGQSRNRGVGQSNTGASNGVEGSLQNTRGASTERQVAIDNGSEGVNTSTQGNRGGNTSLGGERRPAGGLGAPDTSSRDESFGNH